VAVQAVVTAGEARAVEMVAVKVAAREAARAVAATAVVATVGATAVVETGVVAREAVRVAVAMVVATHTAPSRQRIVCCAHHPHPRRCTSQQTSCPHIPAQAGRRAALHGSPAHQ